MQGNGWDFAANHRIRLEVTQSDAPYLRMDTHPVASAVTYSSVTLTLPAPGGP
jgi:hypothetical protein